MLSVDTGLDPLLRRPLSIHRWIDGNIQLLYRVVGKGTAMLSEKRPGSVLEVLGPLGNDFPTKKTPRNIILVAGGLGIAPLFSLAESLTHQRGKKIITPDPPIRKGGRKTGLPNRGDGPLLFYGARTGEEVLCIDELKSIGMKPIISTDDGTLGNKGNVVTVLKEYLDRNQSLAANCIVFGCGPKPMLKSLSALTKTYNLQGYIALEENMACGLGTCLGCVVNTVKGYKRVCKEGPVFPIEEIVWE